MPSQTLRLPALALTALGLLTTVVPGWAADSGRIGAEAQYKLDVAACNSGQTGQTRQACMAEAVSARNDARHNRLQQDDAHYDQNRVARCQRLPAGDQAACVGQMTGQGTIYGNVPAGGILREITVPDTSASAAPDMASPRPVPAVGPGASPSLTPVPLPPPPAYPSGR